MLVLKSVKKEEDQKMKRSRFTEQQISFALHQAEQGTSVDEIIRKMGITEQTFYRWKKNSVV
jgi:putative transposase